MGLRQRQGRPEAEVQAPLTCLSLEVSSPLPGLGETELITNTPFPSNETSVPQHSPGGIPSLFPGRYPGRKEGYAGRAYIMGGNTEEGRKRDRKGFTWLQKFPSLSQS